MPGGFFCTISTHDSYYFRYDRPLEDILLCFAFFFDIHDAFATKRSDPRMSFAYNYFPIFVRPHLLRKKHMQRHPRYRTLAFILRPFLLPYIISFASCTTYSLSLVICIQLLFHLLAQPSSSIHTLHPAS
jgi:hypothetical protein